MPTSVRLDPDIEIRLTALSTQTGRTKAYYLREIIRNGLEDAEDYYLAQAVMERVRTGEEKIFTLDEVEAQLGLRE